MLFEGVHFFISPSFSPQRQQELAKVLKDNGGQEATLLTSTHVITNSTEFEGWEQVPGSVCIVSDKWVDRSMIFGKQQDAGLYSADSRMIFSGIIACSTELDTSDREVIGAGITALGGLFREGLTRDCTHLLAPYPGSDKYEAAMHFKSATDIKIVVPHWFDDCFRLMRLLDEGPYEWPNPQALEPTTDGTNEKSKSAGGPISDEKRLLFKTVTVSANPTSSKDSEYVNARVEQDIWKGKRIMLSASLELAPVRRETLEVAIKRAGGVPFCAANDQAEVQHAAGVDVLVTKYRAGRGYLRAIQEKKTVGTLAWLFHVQRTGVIVRPQDQLLHYPMRKIQISGFNKHIITVTNYTGEARDYIKRLIMALGAEFTPTLTARNTVVIAAFFSGTKTTKAREWSIPVVNHTWIEDCFAEWKNLTPALDKYISFPPAIDFAKLLGDRKIGRIDPEFEESLVLEVEQLEKEEAARAKENVNPRAAAEVVKASTSRKNGVPSTSQLSRTDTVLENEIERAVEGMVVEPTLAPSASMNDVREVEMAVSIPEDVEMDELDTITEKPMSTRSVAASARRAKNPPLRSNDKGKDRAGDNEAMDVDEISPVKRKEVKRVYSTQKRREEEIREAGPSRRDGKNRAEALDNDLDEGHRPQTKGAKPTKSNAKAAPPENLEDSDEELPAAISDFLDSQPRQKQRARDSTPPREQGAEDAPRRSVRKSASKARESIKRASILPKLDGDKPGRSRSRRRSLSRRRSTASYTERDPDVADLRSAVNSDDEEGLAMRERYRKRRSLSRATNSRRASPSAHIVNVDDEDEEEHDEDRTSRSRSTQRKPLTTRTTRSQSRSALRRQVPAENQASTSSILKRPELPKSTVSVVIPISSISPQSHRETHRPTEAHKTPSKPSTRQTNSKRKAPSPEEEDEDEDEDEEEDVSAEEVRPEPPRSRGRPKKKAPTPAPVRRREEESADEEPSTRRGRSNKNAQPPSPSPAELMRLGTQRSPSKRTAATKATQKLHEEIMPDMNNFQKQLKKGNVRGAWENQDERGGRRSGHVEESAGDKRRRASSVARTDGGDVTDAEGSRKNKKRGRNADEETGNAAEKRNAKKSKVTQRSESSEIDEPVKTTPAKGSKPNGVPGGSQRTGCDPKDIRVLMTGISLPPEEIKNFHRLGPKMADNPEDCTHLIARTCGRTEKLLCAIAVAPYILTEKWISACNRAKAILPEDDYRLVDTEAERKYGFKLTETLRRARDAEHRLFYGHTFYVTPKVQVKMDMFKKIIGSASGKAIYGQNPTVRILAGHDDRHVISCEDDKKIWAPLAENNIPIYTSELILAGILTQRVEWDNDELKVPGSY